MKLPTQVGISIDGGESHPSFYNSYSSVFEVAPVARSAIAST